MAKMRSFLSLNNWSRLIKTSSIIVLTAVAYQLTNLHSKHGIVSHLTEPPILNKEYIALTDSEILPKILPEETVSVVEFFSYHCDTCYEIEPTVRAWLKLHASFVQFLQIPVGDDSAFSNNIVRLHYLAHQLKKEMTAILFKWLQEGKDIKNLEVIRNSLLEIGVSDIDYEQANEWQAGLDAQIARGKNLEKLYNIEEIPVFVIGGRYKTSPIMTDGNLLRFFEVMDALIEKVKQGNH